MLSIFLLTSLVGYNVNARCIQPASKILVRRYTLEVKNIVGSMVFFVWEIQDSSTLPRHQFPVNKYNIKKVSRLNVAEIAQQPRTAMVWSKVSQVRIHTMDIHYWWVLRSTKLESNVSFNKISTQKYKSNLKTKILTNFKFKVTENTELTSLDKNKTCKFLVFVVNVLPDTFVLLLHRLIDIIFFCSLEVCQKHFCFSEKY